MSNVLTIKDLLEQVKAVKIRAEEASMCKPPSNVAAPRTIDDEVVCPYCEKKFNDEKEFYIHRWNNLHEGYVRDFRGKLACTICHQLFRDMDEFLDHWNLDPHHEEEASIKFLDNLNKREHEQGEWVIQPVERERLRRRLYHDPKLRQARYGQAAGPIAVEQMQYVIKYNAMIVGEIYGVSEAGKSRFELSLIETYLIPLSRKRLAEDWLKDEVNHDDAVEHQLQQKLIGNPMGFYRATIHLMTQRGIWREPRVFFTFSVAESMAVLRKAKPYDHIMQDEDPGLLGKGRDSTIRKMRSILKLFRAKRVNFHFISPDEISYTVNTNLMFEVTHKKWPLDQLITRAIMFDADGVSLGWIQLKVLTNEQNKKSAELHDLLEIDYELLWPELTRGLQDALEPSIEKITNGEDVELPVMVIYEVLKYENLRKMQIQEGSASMEWDLKEVEEKAKEAAMALVKEYGTDRAAGFPIDHVQSLMPGVGVSGQGDFQDIVGRHAKFYLDKWAEEGYLGVKSTSVDSVNIEDIPKPEPVVVNFSLNEADYLPKIRELIGTDKHKWVTAYENFLAKESGWSNYRQIAESLGLKSSGNVSDRFAEIKGHIRKLQGDLFEVEMYNLYKDFEHVEMMKPATSEPAPQGVPDRIVILKDGRIRICSWKCTPSNATIPITGPEMKKARQMLNSGTRVTLVLEGIGPDGFFSVEIDPDSDKLTRTIFKRECSDFPPDMYELLEFEKPEADEDNTEQFMKDLVELGKLEGLEMVEKVLDTKIEQGQIKPRTKSLTLSYVKQILEETKDGGAT